MKLANITPHDKFDFFRGIAALAVLGGHTLGACVYRLTGMENNLAFTSEFISSHAVLVFFLLSGYLITGSLIKNINQNGSLNIMSYLVARATRIYPPLVGAVLICILCWLPIYGLHLPGSDNAYGLPSDLYQMRDYYKFGFADIPRALFFLNGMRKVDGPLWSLNIECVDYLLVLLVFMAVLAPTKMRRILIVVVIIGLLVFGKALNRQFFFFTGVWGMGSMLAMAHAWRPDFRRRFDWKWDVVFGITLALLLLFAAKYAFHDKHAQVASYGSRALFCAVYAYFIFISSLFEKFRYPKWLLAPADYSYSLYVIHFPLLLLVSSLTQGWVGVSLSRAWMTAGVAGLMIALIAYFFAKLFENQPLFRPYIAAALARAQNFIFRLQRR